MRVKFLRDEQYESEGRNQGPKFAEGEVYDFTDDFGNRWVQRGAAEVLDPDIQVDENTFKAVTKTKVEPKPPVEDPIERTPNETVEGPALSPKPAADPLTTADVHQPAKPATHTAPKTSDAKGRATKR